MFLSSLFFEEKREHRRLNKGRSKLMDIFWYSGVKDYSYFRFCYNFPIGFGICLIVYLLAWKRLNFLEFNDIGREVFKWTIVTCFALAFSLNAIFRCALLCVCVGALSKTGQGFLTVFIVDQLSEGPVKNIVENFRLTSSIVLCHLDMQSRITAQRITLASGPMEALLEKHFGQSATIGRKVVRTLKSLIEPFTGDISSSTEEDEILAAVIDNAQAMADRQQIVQGRNLAGETSSTPVPMDEVQPVWTKFKSKLGRSIARRFTQRCQQMFAGAIEKCHKKFQDAQPSGMTSAASKHCALGQKLDEDNPLTPDLDDQMDSMENISKQIKDQLKLNIHFKAVEEPESEWIRALSEIEVTVQNNVEWFMMALGVFKDILSGCLVFIVYWVFRANVNAITSYLKDIEFKNKHLTNYFWYIDNKRKEQGLETLEPLQEEEIGVNGLISPYGWPTAEELRATWVSFLRWSVIFLVALVVVVIDYYYYIVLVHAVNYGESHGMSKGEHTMEITVEGEGPIAEMIRDIVNFNYSTSSLEEMTNVACLSEPLSPVWRDIYLWLFMPLAAMLVLQVLCTIVIGRLTLFCVIGVVFRRRSKARIVHLYNRLLAERKRKIRRKHLLDKILRTRNSVQFTVVV